MNTVPRILTIQDMSSIGRCALTVMIPIISAMRCQAVPLATAVLSNHLEYPHYEFVDLSDHMRDFMDCWEKNNIDFHAIVSGFLASPEQIHLVEEAINRFGNTNQMIIVDPAMADDGRLYSIYTSDMVVAMRHLVSKAHIVKPNYTEACFLLDIPYSTHPISEDELRHRCKQLHQMGPDMVIMTSVPSETHATVAVYDGITDNLQTYSIPLVPVKATGTGDIFTAVLSGAVMKGYSPYDAAELAMNFTTKAIQATVDNVKSMKHGVAFELVLPELIKL
ncbi:pyridoxamine kinase [Veillonella rodentium]|uniref:pyridoxal kinase n=1 Tax=Veillonella rodentium TaxID=248315 RepID=A0A239YND1_9FIRM|nr:pyridoxamine kinase [Veillonella rodentium]SNV59704.1 Hydroxymethylpyrimidine/phosphomethylpyrimidine kinase [Veillonella rodentium]